MQAAQSAAGGQQYPAATLYLVPTPIGNLADVSLRSLHVLALVDAVACEDTRVSGQLLHHLGLHKPLLSLHQHNEQSASAALVVRLQSGERIAYVSDAGTPAVSDPGAVLVAAVQRAGLRVMPLPGPSAVVTALSAAGDARAQGFAFAGFLPPKGQERRARLQGLLGSAQSQVVFEAPHRIANLLELLAELAPAQTLTVCRELSKQFETVHSGPAAEMPAWLAADPQRERGEFVLVLHAEPPQAASEGLPAEVTRLLERLLLELPLKQAVQIATDLSGLPRNSLYEAALQMKKAAEA